MTKEQFYATSDKSGPAGFGPERGGAVPPVAANHICDFCKCRTAAFYLPKLKKWCCKKRSDKCPGPSIPNCVCKYCGSLYDSIDGHGGFCSTRCHKLYGLQAARKSPKLIAHYHDKRWRIKNGGNGWLCSYCGLSFDTRKELKTHTLDNHDGSCYEKGGHSWQQNKEKQKRAIEKQKNTKLKQKQSGIFKPSFLGKHHTKETKELLSMKRIEMMLNNNTLGRRPDVKWYMVKNIIGDEYANQGTWERDVAIWLNSKNILWVKRKTIEYLTSDKIKKFYIPDFYLPDSDEYIEVKGYFDAYDKKKMNYVLSSNPGIKIRFIHGKKCVNQLISDKITLKDVELYKPQ